MFSLDDEQSCLALMYARDASNLVPFFTFFLWYHFVCEVNDTKVYFQEKVSCMKLFITK